MDWQVYWLYTKYQLLTKSLIALLVVPAYAWVAARLFHSTGRPAISSGDFTGFFTTWEGLIFALLSLVMMVVMIGTDIAAFAVAELALLRGEYLTARGMLWRAIKSLRRFLHPATLLLLVYVGVLVPLASATPSLQLLRWIQVPNFVTDVIWNNTLYTVGYTAALVVIGLVSFFLVFTIQAMFVDEINPGKAMIASAKFVRGHMKQTIWAFLRAFGSLIGVIVATSLGVALVLWLLWTVLPDNQLWERFMAINSVLLVGVVAGIVVWLWPPIRIRAFTRLYYFETTPDEMRSSTPEHHDRRARWWLAGTTVVGVLGVAAISFAGAKFFDDVFQDERTPEIIAHRGGGVLDAENSIAGVELAIAEGAAWTEIDVQRTADGQYVINHDGSFSRVAGVDKSSKDMTLDEIQQLEIENQFTDEETNIVNRQPSPEALETHGVDPQSFALDQPRPVPTIEDMMDVANDRIGLFIELKGSTADEQMVDDMVALIRERGLENQAAIITLDYDLIRYTEDHYPDIITGYLYFFAAGDVSELRADYLIMEEGMATNRTVANLQAAGKKVAVWTVNRPMSIRKFASSDVDAVITDYPVEMREALEEHQVQSDFDRILDAVLLTR